MIIETSEPKKVESAFQIYGLATQTASFLTSDLSKAWSNFHRLTLHRLIINPIHLHIILGITQLGLVTVSVLQKLGGSL